MFVDVRLQLGPRQSPMPLLAPLTSRVICKTCEKTVIKQGRKEMSSFLFSWRKMSKQLYCLHVVKSLQISCNMHKVDYFDFLLTIFANII